MLRALQRARGMVANAPLSSTPLVARSPELRPLRDVPSNGGRASQDGVEHLASSLRFLETARTLQERMSVVAEEQ